MNYTIRLSLASGLFVLLPAVLLKEDRVVPSDGTNPYDRLLVSIDKKEVWVERRDLYHEDGEWIDWYRIKRDSAYGTG